MSDIAQMFLMNGSYLGGERPRQNGSLALDVEHRLLWVQKGPSQGFVGRCILAGWKDEFLAKFPAEPRNHLLFNG